MTTADERAIADPLGTVVDMVTATETGLDPAVVTAVTEKIAAGRAKRRRLAAALVQDPEVLAHGKSPAPRVVGELLIALRTVGATTVSAPRCATCGKELRSLQRRGQDWFCGPCVERPEPCSACGCLRRVAFRDPAGRPRCSQCPETDCIPDPVAAICTTVAAVSPDLEQDTVAAAARGTVSSLHQQRRLAQELISAPELLTGDGHLTPVRSVLGLVEILTEAGAEGIVRPACGRCRRVVRLDKPLDGVRVCRNCIALDEFGQDETVRHLRSVLVASGALPARDEYLARLEQWLDETIASVADAQDRYVVHRYATWHHLRRLRRRAAASGVTYGQAASLRRRVRAAMDFLQLLAGHGLTLAACRKEHLESWLADGLGHQRLDTGAFVRWATANKLAKLDFPATKWHGPAGAIDVDHRWQTAHRLLHDDSLSASIRAAGLLVVLYAQPVADIARLTIDDVTITDERVDLMLGSAPITLPEPMDVLVTQLAATRRGHAVSGHHAAPPWLFPGGQPGQPISAYRLRERIGTVGITGSLRTTALFQLATELPAAILARTLGIHIRVAVQWQRAAAGDWAAYAAEVSRRTKENPAP